MFYLPLAVLTWIVAPWVIERARLPGLLLYGLHGAVLATVQDRFVMFYHLWEYADVGPLDSHAEIALLISLSAAPLFAMRFVQGLSGSEGPPWRRMFKFTLVSMLPEVVGLLSDHIRYHNWWNVGWSVLAYAPIWLSLWALHRWMTRSRAGVEQTKTARGT